ncbi:MAG: peptidoglycan DD-metalloendopeptidase family protein [Lachnospiraceae bacterium]
MKRRRRNQKRERILVLMSSLFVLTALTLTGVYVKERNKVNQDYVVDLSGMKNNERAEESASDTAMEENSRLVSSGKVENPVIEEESDDKAETVFPWELVENNSVSGGEGTESEQEEQQPPEEKKQETEKLTFPEGETLAWPVVGNVLINFSMDKPVYFASLEQYKVNPGIVIQAAEGQQISAAARGRISKIVKEEETGNTIYMDIGSGYQAVYGQLTNIQVKEGDLIEKGTYMADVAAPTKYYSVEGCNVYFAVLKNGVPVDPLGRLK